MKTLFLGLLVATLFIGGCQSEEDENVSVEPFIENAEVSFINPSDASRADSIKLTFELTDGDFDLGLNSSEPVDVDSPYHAFYFFLENNKKLDKIAFRSKTPYFLSETSKPGKLVTFGYQKKIFPDSPPVFSYKNYFKSSFRVRQEDLMRIDNPKIIRIGEEFEIVDTLLVEYNTHHYNLIVDYFVEQPDGSFTLYNTWMENFGLTFNARFPLLNGNHTIQNGPFYFTRISKSKGRLTYTMVSYIFKNLLQGRRIKLRISIKDRALHESNVIETAPIFIN